MGYIILEHTEAGKMSLSIVVRKHQGCQFAGSADSSQIFIRFVKTVGFFN